MPTENFWWVSEYAEDIHSHLLKKQRCRLLYRGQSPQISLRRLMVNWLEMACERLQFSKTVHHLAMYLLDMFMDNHDIVVEHLRLVALGCLIVAVKLEEKDSLLPRLSEFNALIGNSYRIIELVQMEISVLEFFQWDVLIPTVAHFLEYYSIHAVRLSDYHACKPLPSLNEAAVFLQQYLDYFSDISLREQIFLTFEPSVVAAACVLSTRICLQLSPIWPVYLQNVTHCKIEHIMPCSNLLQKILEADNKALEKNCREKELFAEDSSPCRKSDCGSTQCSPCSNG